MYLVALAKAEERKTQREDIIHGFKVGPEK